MSSFHSHCLTKGGRRGFRNAIGLVPHDHVIRRLDVAKKYVQMSFTLAQTRANGSNTYTNRRAALYAERMSKRYDVSHDSTECSTFYAEFVGKTQVLPVP